MTERKKIQHYKLLGGEDGLHACHGGCMVYRRGVWMKPIDDVYACTRGYHTVTAKQIIPWLNGVTAVYCCDVRGPVDAGDKYVSRSIRLGHKVMGERELCHLVCDFAAHVLNIFETKRPQDDRVHNCITTAREYADGRATLDDLAAARAAARAAAGVVARDTVWAAETKWQQRRLALYLKGGKPWIEKPVLP